VDQPRIPQHGPPGTRRSVARGLLLTSLTLGLLLVVAVSISKWRSAAVRPHMDDVRRSYGEFGGVIATSATIERNVPPSTGNVLGNNTLVLANPDVLATLEPLPAAGFLVLPKERWVTGQVEIAKRTKAELNLARNSHAMLPAAVEILQIQGPGSLRRMDKGRINYVRIED